MKSTRIWLIVVFAPAIPLILASLLLGPSIVAGPREILRFLLTASGALGSGLTPADDLVRSIVLDVRMPRVLLAFVVGAALTVSGTVLQAIFRNPLVSPYILGLSSGSAFGAALALSLGWLPLQPAAFTGGAAAVGLSYFIARTRGRVPAVSLILAGVIVSGLFTALLTIVQFFSDPFKLQTIVQWTIGNLHTASWSKLHSVAIPMLIGFPWLILARWRCTILALGDEETRAVGLNPDRERLLLLIPATLIASASVAVAGVIGLVGLAVPHMLRMMIGPDNRILVPAGIFFGGTFLLVVDDFSRTLSSFELPIGVFTTIIGAPFFVYLLKRSTVVLEG